MNVTQSISMDLLGNGAPAAVHAVQGDTNTRTLEIRLFAGENIWTIPEGVGVLIRYSKSDGTGGTYDTLPDGANAVSIDGNRVRIALAQALLTTPGTAILQILLYQQAQILTSFHIYLHVHPAVGYEEEAPGDYGNLTQWLQSALDTLKAQGALDGEARTMPQYIRDRAQEIARQALDIEGIGDDTEDHAPFHLAFLTDLHWNVENDLRLQSAVKALSVISETVTPDAIVFGGDYIGSENLSTAEAQVAIDNARRIFSGFSPALWLRGNEDGNELGQAQLSKAQVFNRIGAAQQTLPGYVSNPADPFGCYGYLDFENSRIRLICLNTADRDAMGTPDVGTAADYPNISPTQLQWIADNAMDLTGKSDGGDWGLVFLSHACIYNGGTHSGTYTDTDGTEWEWNVSDLEEMAKAYQKQGSFSVTRNGETVSKNFSECETGRILCFINGGGHNTDHCYHYGIPHISCPNAGSGGETESGDWVLYPKTDLGTVSETAFSFITIDPAGNTFHIWVYGAGYTMRLR